MSSLVFARSKRRNAASTLGQIDVVVDNTSERPMSDDDSSTIINSIEKTSKIVGGPSRLDLTRAPTCPLPTVSPSPVPGEQTVVVLSTLSAC